MSRTKPLHIVTFVLFIGVLVFPWVAGVFGASSDTVERRRPAAFPAVGSSTVGEARTFAQINEYVRDRTPLRGQMTGWVNGAWLPFGLSGDPTVVEGPDDYYFLAEDFTGPCNREYELDDMVDQFELIDAAAQRGGKDFLFLVASDKGAVLDYRLGERARLAAQCSREARPEFRAALDSTGVSFDLAPSLIAADRAFPDAGRWYYEHDSHWTFEAGGIVAGDIVGYFDDDLYDPKVIRKIERALPINGDVYRRMGIQRSLDIPDNVRISDREGVFTDRSEENIDGTRTVRTYLSGGDGETISGSTVIIHDSMMNFVERQLAPYFEEAVFIHWDDLELDRAKFLDRVALSDRLIMVSVERQVHRVIAGRILEESFAQPLMDALEIAPDVDLKSGLIESAGAVRNYTRDTGTFVESFDDLFVDPGVEGWAGPYLDVDVAGVWYPEVAGDWGTVHEPMPTSPLTDCADYNSGDCAVWLTLTGVPEASFAELDAELDGSDGATAGRVRFDDGTLYFYSLA